MEVFLVAIGLLCGLGIEKIQSILRLKDPVHSCEVYKSDESCAHVDGPLCKFPNCHTLLEHRFKEASIKIVRFEDAQVPYKIKSSTGE
jgi:hypothetical protein